MEAVDKMLAQDISPLMSLITKEEAVHHVEPQVKGEVSSVQKYYWKSGEKLENVNLMFSHTKNLILLDRIF